MRMLTGLAKLLPMLLALVTPLSDAERTVIETARDDRSHEEEAFAVLLTHASAWTGELGDEPIRLQPNFAAMVEHPDNYRGELCRIEGRLEQRTGLGGAFEGDEWFVRTKDGTPVVVYLPIDERMKTLRDGQHIAINARFYKRMRFEGRDDSERAFAAFVGARPWLVEAPNPWRHLWVLAALVMVLLVTFLVLFAIVRRGGAARRDASRLRTGAWGDERGEHDDLLPSDPAAALEELRRRKGAQP
jgi:hypothetical protein